MNLARSLPIAFALVVGCTKSDGDYFRRITEGRMEDIGKAARIAATSRNVQNLDDLMQVAASDGLFPKGDIAEVQKDGWGTTFKLNQDPSSVLTLRSAGPDLSFDTHDDIVKQIALDRPPCD